VGIFGCGVIGTAVWGTAVYAFAAPAIPRVGVALVAGSCLVGAMSGLLGYRLGTFLERARK